MTSPPPASIAYRRASERAKEDPVIFEHLGDALLKNGLDEDAAAAWEKSLQLDPGADGVKQKLEDVRARLRRAQSERPKGSQ